MWTCEVEVLSLILAVNHMLSTALLKEWEQSHRCWVIFNDKNGVIGLILLIVISVHKLHSRPHLNRFWFPAFLPVTLSLLFYLLLPWLFSCPLSLLCHLGPECFFLGEEVYRAFPFAWRPSLGPPTVGCYDGGTWSSSALCSSAFGWGIRCWLLLWESYPL